MMEIADFAAFLRDSVEDIGLHLSKDEDWLPTLFVIGPDGASIAGIPDFAKNAVTQAAHLDVVIPKIVRKHNGTLAAIVSTAWAVEYEGKGHVKRAAKDLRSYGSPSKHPQRFEIVVAYICTASGHELMLSGRIDRSGEHPRIVSWQSEEVGNNVLAGAIPDALRKALR